MSIVAVCSTHHQLARQSSVSLNQVMQHTWTTILSAPNTMVCDPDSIQRQIALEHNSLAIELCCKGVGVFAGQLQQLQPHINSGKLKGLTHSDAIASEQLGVVYPKHPTVYPTVQALIKICKVEFA